ncbi:sucrose-6-phosphate hydrolase [Companilactobacillus alimentarius]|uniref:Sucrose-6-phosphate hydrolase n=1 Tax=Companilactobacillus alimentarius DSM 20249 TaxID=1423720 RepID=A0A2K9HIT5_9LACO|nr:sucrose-6-phosphate hydrolase [Companilactobacillus alimentarius]AUI71686.1 sucrose-6-phosphate hydrolase [Companilactobacillus alimentarius DSM 20249]KRK78299.1 beta-fructofuranosidase [Companilactobacillus alimentarius DSM 20249]MDT6953322.1 sucrose-6-phosphate hydrolase [Companilactobacillus alimentarius]GEO44571.1 invertase [Companilactobacillus alimentarius]
MITNWTTELRYRPYQAWSNNQIEDIRKKIGQSHWRLGYHIQPKTGLLNDPNGFSYFNGQWHLFYQSYPYGAVHGLKNWSHLISDDLVHWQDYGPTLLPGDKQDSHGTYSGSAIPVGDKLFLMYTGNVRDKNWVRHPKQDGAWMDQNNKVEKISTPLIPEPKSGFTDHFRDPQIIEHDGQYFALIGGRKKDDTGHILVYQAAQVTGPWSYKTELKFTQQDCGYMIECPNLLFVDDRPVLIFCPQGVNNNVLKHDNVFPNAYVIGERFDWETFTFINPSKMENLDNGFDVYATHGFNAPDGRALTVSWIGLPDTSYPSDNEGWANCFSLIKELKIKNNQLYQIPVIENEQLIEQKLASKEITPQAKLSGRVLDSIGTLTIKTDLGEELQVMLDTTNGKILVDRTNMGIKFATDFGTTRSAETAINQSIDFEMYLDNTVFELYINGGQKVITGRIFPQGQRFFVESEHVSIKKVQLDKIY